MRLHALKEFAWVQRTSFCRRDGRNDKKSDGARDLEGLGEVWVGALDASLQWDTGGGVPG